MINKSNNIIFCDFDGVIRVPLNDGKALTVSDSDFCPARIAKLESFCRATGAKIVVSSDWRNFGNKEKIIEHIGERLGQHLHETPNKDRDASWMTPISGQRYEEVEQWLDENKACRFAVLEDSDFHFPKEKTNPIIFKNIVWCEWKNGLTDKSFAELEKIFS